MNISALSSNAPLSKPNRYKFNGNEEQTDFDLNLYDFNARFFDQQIARFVNIDPMADQMGQESLNPYHYSYNNPILFTDPEGLFGDYFDGTGNHLGSDGIDDDKIYTVSDKNEAKSIRKATKKGNTTDLKDVKSAMEQPSLELLEISLDVLDRTLDNGGTREEGTLRQDDGSTIDAEPGPEMATTPDGKTSYGQISMPRPQKGKKGVATIHSHQTKALVEGNKFYSPHIMDPSPRGDKQMFAKHDVNIIVGRMGPADVSKSNNPHEKPRVVNAQLGIAAYGRSTTKPKSVITRKAAQKIVKYLKGK